MITFLILAVVAWLIFMPPEGLRGIAPGRAYKSGTGWCAWRWTDVDSKYITRLHVVKTPWFAVCLHWINSPDVEPWLHDHPVSFLSCVLRGKYCELRASGDGDVGHRVHTWFNIIRASKFDRHRIIFVRQNTLTLCFMGPKTREWGFHMPEGWVHWKEYYARLRAGENMRCEPKGAVPFLPALERELMARYYSEPGSCVYTTVDEDKRVIDTAEAEPFDAEEITSEYER